MNVPHITYPFTNNIGDDVQNVPLMLLLKEKCKIVPRDSIEENINSIDRFILHGWLSRNSFGNFDGKEFAKRSSVISAHIDNKLHLEGSWREFFQTCPIVFARDEYTVNLLAQHKVKSKFSGCLTSMYGDLFGGVSDQGYILCTEKKYLAQLRGRKVLFFEPLNTPRHIQFNVAERLAYVSTWLSVISGASLIISDRLHTLMPAASLGKRVKFPNVSSHIQPTGPATRFSGLSGAFTGSSVSKNIDFISNLKQEHMYHAVQNIEDFVDVMESKIEPLDISDPRSIYSAIIDKISHKQRGAAYFSDLFDNGHRAFFNSLVVLGYRSALDLPPIIKKYHDLIKNFEDPLLESSINLRDRSLYWVGRKGANF